MPTLVMLTLLTSLMVMVMVMMGESMLLMPTSLLMLELIVVLMSTWRLEECLLVLLHLPRAQRPWPRRLARRRARWPAPQRTGPVCRC